MMKPRSGYMYSIIPVGKLGIYDVSTLDGNEHLSKHQSV